MNHRFVLLAGLALAGVLALAAPAASLNVGDLAPKLQTGKFVQGDPVSDFAPGKAYIVEFWATWCGPCKASIPHLNETYAKFKDQGLIVIGQDCSEPDDGKVAPFVKSMGEKMTYRVALDDKAGGGKGKMADTWMSAAGEGGIPCAFLVDTTGHIAWIGHPMALKETTIEAVLAGKFNAKETAAAEEKAQSQEKSLNETIQAAVQAKDWDKARKAFDELASLAAGDDAMATPLAMTHFTILVGKQDFPAAFAVLRHVGELTKDNAFDQNLLALLLTTDKTIVHPDLDLAQTFAQRAVDLAQQDAAKTLESVFLDTLARVKFMKGNQAEAMVLEQKALGLIADNSAPPDLIQKLQTALDDFKQGELPKPMPERSKPAAAQTAGKSGV
jgi:thiol-disulfide isomerase/thioredoxin